MSHLADPNIFCGGNIVFICPDERKADLQLQLNELAVRNNIFGVRESKGLEFDSVCLIGFLQYIEDRCSGAEWKNALLWLFSKTSLSVTSSSEQFFGARLTDCDYTISSPQVSDEAMMLYTALTRSRNRLYLVEGDIQSSALSWREKLAKGKRSVPLVDEAIRRFSELSLAKRVDYINEGTAQMSSAQHKARGVLLVTQALQMSTYYDMKEKFNEAIQRFGPDKGNDFDLLKKAKRHLRAIELKHNLTQLVFKYFVAHNNYNLESKFAEVLKFEGQLLDFASRFLGDPFLWREMKEVKCLVEEVFVGTLYEFRFADFFSKCREMGY